jgi:hypothetical protein
LVGASAIVTGAIISGTGDFFMGAFIIVPLGALLVMESRVLSGVKPRG